MQAQRDVGRLGHSKIGVNNKRRIVAGLEKGRLKTSVASFAKKSEASFAKTDKVNFAKTNVLIGLSDDLERKMVYKTEKIFHSI